MSSPSSPTLLFDVSSRRAESRVAWMTLVGCAAAAVLASLSIEGSIAGALDPALPFGAAAAAFVACAIATLGLWRAGWLGGRGRIEHLTWRADGGWLLTDASGRRGTARLRRQTRVAGRWIWLSWGVDRRRARSLLLAPGDLPPDDLRRLAVRLRVGLSGRRIQAIPAP